MVQGEKVVQIAAAVARQYASVACSGFFLTDWPGRWRINGNPWGPHDMRLCGMAEFFNFFFRHHHEGSRNTDSTQ
jgi:hypothetical protein